MLRLLVISVLVLLASCAQVVSPSGGPMDVRPPIALRYMPDSAATNVHPTKIQIQFDEYVQVQNLMKEFSVSPALKRTPDIAANGKTITIRLSDTLEENTTYILDFGRSISDITEGNAAPFRYIFSTGPVIDSLRMSGEIIHALTKKAEPDMTVMLYRTMEDTIPYSGKPYYYTKANKEGKFLFTNLKAGSYKLFAVRDANNNFIPDQEEAIAYADLPVVVDTSAPHLKLESFVEEPAKLFLKKSEIPLPGKILLVYSKNAGDVNLNFPDPKKTATVHVKEYSRDKDTVTVWYTDPVSDSLFFVASTSLTVDTIEKKHPVTRTGKAIVLPGIISSDIEPNGTLYKDDVTFITSAPLVSIDTSKILLDVGRKKDTTVVIEKDSSDRKRFTLKMNFTTDTSNRLAFYPGALKFITGTTNDTIRYTFGKRSTDKFGTILLKMENVKEPGIVEVLQESGVVKGRLAIKPGGTNELFIKNLPAGSYSARFISDKNNNGKWDTGNYLKKQKPEPVMLLNKGLPVKEGWDLEEDWKLGE